MNYYKLIDSELVDMPVPKYISNPTDEQLADYATANGWVALVTVERPSIYHSLSYEPADGCITQAWTAPELAALKAVKMAEVEALTKQRVSAETTVEVAGIGVFVYDQQAAINVLAVQAQGSGEGWRLADTSTVELTAEQVETVGLAFIAHTKAIYTLASYIELLLDSAETVDDLLAIEVAAVELPTDSEEAEL